MRAAGQQQQLSTSQPGEQGGTPSSWAQKQLVVTPELLPKGQQRGLRSPGLLLKEEGEGAVAFSAFFFLTIFIKYKSILCVHNSQNQPCLLQRLHLEILQCQKHNKSTIKESVCWRGGQLSYLCTPQPPEALLGHSAAASAAAPCYPLLLVLSWEGNPAW